MAHNVRTLADTDLRSLDEHGDQASYMSRIALANSYSTTRGGRSPDHPTSTFSVGSPRKLESEPIGHQSLDSKPEFHQDVPLNANDRKKLRRTSLQSVPPTVMFSPRRLPDYVFTSFLTPEQDFVHPTRRSWTFPPILDWQQA